MAELHGFYPQDASALLRMLQQWKAGQFGAPQGGSSARGVRPDIVRYKFVQSGQTLPAYGIAEIYGVETAGEWTLTVKRPTGDDKSLYLVNTNMEVAHNAYGWGCLALCAPVYALYDDAATPAYGEIWGPASSTYKLTKHRCGFQIMGGATGGSTDRVYVMQANLGDGRIMVGKSDAAIAKGATGTVSRWGGATLADTGINDTVTNNLGDIGSGAWVYYARPHACDEYHVVNAEC